MSKRKGKQFHDMRYGTREQLAEWLATDYPNYVEVEAPEGNLKVADLTEHKQGNDIRVAYIREGEFECCAHVFGFFG